jgi:redox-sensitive bicupin YhaK (pirin superfamily)
MKKLLSIKPAARQHWVGDGFPVRNAFSYDEGAKLSPFLYLDYAGPVAFPPSEHRRGVGPHPHRGFETVTIVYSGEVEHRDSGGGCGIIRAGDVQWMTAASGIVHEELHGPYFAKSGGVFEMIQLWINLRAKHKKAPPGYQTIRDTKIPRVELPSGAGLVRVIAGSFQGIEGPAHTYSPVNVWDVRLARGATVEFEVRAGWTAALFVLSGAVQFGPGEVAQSAELAVFEREGESFIAEALEETRLLFLSGEPIDEPIVGQGPFVMNTMAEIEQAVADYRAGRMGRLAAHA